MPSSSKNNLRKEVFIMNVKKLLSAILVMLLIVTAVPVTTKADTNTRDKLTTTAKKAKKKTAKAKKSIETELNKGLKVSAKFDGFKIVATIVNKTKKIYKGGTYIYTIYDKKGKKVESGKKERTIINDKFTEVIWPKENTAKKLKKNGFGKINITFTEIEKSKKTYINGTKNIQVTDFEEIPDDEGAIIGYKVTNNNKKKTIIETRYLHTTTSGKTYVIDGVVTELAPKEVGEFSAYIQGNGEGIAKVVIKVNAITEK